MVTGDSTPEPTKPRQNPCARCSYPIHPTSGGHIHAHCTACNRLFPSGSSNALYCPLCRAAKERSRDAERNRRRPGASRSDLPRKAKLGDGNRCKRCGSRDQIVANHIIPIAMGGRHELSNLITMCKRCHEDYHRALTKV
jgi:5-methylcytosine-specific restriction endonuclease McrA